jgi:hypothetical protein
MTLAVWRLAICGTLILQTVGCRRPTQGDYYDFDFQRPPDVKQLVSRSSAIVVGTVACAKAIREGVPARKQPELLLDQIRADVAVENVLLGDIKQTRLEIEFFAYSRKNRGGYTGPSLLTVGPGERWMFFLTRESGVYRSVADVRGSNALTVGSGLHKNVRHFDDPQSAWMVLYTSDTDIGNSISDVLLDLGEGYSASGVARTLNSSVYVSSTLSTRKKTVARLLKLVANEREPVIGAEACLILAEQFYGQYACLQKFLDNPALSADVHKSMMEMQSKRLNWNKRLKYDLRVRPLFAFSMVPDSILGVRDELELLLDDPDSELRQLACAALKQNYPDSLTKCNASR